MVEAVLHRSTFDVDLYGVSCYAKDLGNNYEIVDHNSGDTLVICEDGKIINVNYHTPKGMWFCLRSFYKQIKALH